MMSEMFRVQEVLQMRAFKRCQGREKSSKTQVTSPAEVSTLFLPSSFYDKVAFVFSGPTRFFCKKKEQQQWVPLYALRFTAAASHLN
jgi:hypothetical protein